MTLLIAAPLLLTLTLLVSGLAKLGDRRALQDAMVSLRIPAPRLHPLVTTVLPTAEIVLGLAWWIPWVPSQTVIALLVALLMATYLAIIARALLAGAPAECSCFGTLASPTVSSSTLFRNILLTALSLIALVAASRGIMTTALERTPLQLLSAALGVGASVLLTVLVLGGVTSADERDAAGGAPAPGPRPTGAGANSGDPGDRGEPGESGEPGDAEEELLDYERTAIPAGVLQRPDGTLVTLRELTTQQAALLVFVSEGCGPCERVMDQFPTWTTELGGFLQVHAVLKATPASLRERTTTRLGEHSLYDPGFSAREALGSRGTPSAVLLGADGMLAGGPVKGGQEVIAFVDEIREQITAAQADGEIG
ncbi:TlpA family protein disulfide reductase [Brachybacterium sp. DNPG3]